MSLKLLQPGVQPFGQFDGLDAEVLTFKGGEVCTFASVASPNPPGTDKAAHDDFDGYSPFGSGKRAVVTRTIGTAGSGTGTTGVRPLMLADDGITGYGTLF